MTRIRTALVIGGGIAGPVAAMALQRAEIDATVYEAHPRGGVGIGIFLTLASNGIDALQAIGAEEGALAAGFPTPGMTLRSTTGKTLGAVRTGLSSSDGVTSHTLKRADLYRAIHEEATARGIAIQHGKRLIEVEQIGDGVRAVFEDRSDAIGDVLIGADGIHSVIRRLIDPAAPAPTYAGLINLGGYTRGVQVDAEPGSYTMIFGNERSSATQSHRAARCGGSPTCPTAMNPPGARSRRSRRTLGKSGSPRSTPTMLGPRSSSCEPATPSTS